MRIVLTFLLLLAFLIPAQAVEDTQYIAVYTSPNLKQCWKECKHKINRIWSTDSWSDFDQFLSVVHAEAKHKTIILDLSCHGNNINGLISKCRDFKEDSIGYYASMGYILNHIEQKLAGDHVVIIFETCYGSYCYKTTIRDNFPVQSKEYFIENHATAVDYPVYGGAYSSNYCTLLLEEYVHSLQGRKPLWLRDLRQSMAETTPCKGEPMSLQNAYLDFLRRLDNK